MAPSGRKRPCGRYRTRAKRFKSTASTKIFICPFKQKLKYWNFVLTLASIPCKFQQNALKEVGAA
jgi:hypothetical protein